MLRRKCYAYDVLCQPRRNPSPKLRARHLKHSFGMPPTRCAEPSRPPITSTSAWVWCFCATSPPPLPGSTPNCWKLPTPTPRIRRSRVERDRLPQAARRVSAEARINTSQTTSSGCRRKPAGPTCRPTPSNPRRRCRWMESFVQEEIGFRDRPQPFALRILHRIGSLLASTLAHLLSEWLMRAGIGVWSKH